MNKETICKIIAGYYKCPILICEPGIEPVSHYVEGVDFYKNEIIAERVNYDPSWIKLLVKPLSKISDDDEREVLKLQGYASEYKDGKLKVFHFSSNDGCLDACICFIGKEHDSYECINSSAYDYLQSKHYALPYMNYSVEDLVKEGIYQLI